MRIQVAFVPEGFVSILLRKYTTPHHTKHSKNIISFSLSNTAQYKIL